MSQVADLWLHTVKTIDSINNYLRKDNVCRMQVLLTGSEVMLLQDRSKTVALGNAACGGTFKNILHTGLMLN